MLVKVLRPGRLLDAVRAFIKEHLGLMFVSASPFDLQEIFAKSDPKVPLLFILAPGWTLLETLKRNELCSLLHTCLMVY